MTIMSVLKSVGKFIVVGRTADLRSIPQKATVFDLGLLPPKTGIPRAPAITRNCQKKEVGGGESSGAACQCQVVWHLGRPSKNVADITVPTTKWCCVVCGWWLRWFHWFW